MTEIFWVTFEVTYEPAGLRFPEWFVLLAFTSAVTGYNGVARPILCPSRQDDDAASRALRLRLERQCAGAGVLRPDGKHDNSPTGSHRHFAQGWPSVDHWRLQRRPELPEECRTVRSGYRNLHRDRRYVVCPSMAQGHPAA